MAKCQIVLDGFSIDIEQTPPTDSTNGTMISQQQWQAFLAAVLALVLQYLFPVPVPPPPAPPPPAAPPSPAPAGPHGKR